MIHTTYPIEERKEKREKFLTHLSDQKHTSKVKRQCFDTELFGGQRNPGNRGSNNAFITAASGTDCVPFVNIPEGSGMAGIVEEGK
ncbi:1636_t:CDS:2, partial [Acaulospora colombiana]